MAMSTTITGKLLATDLVRLIVVSLVRGHSIDKRDLGDLYGCYVVDGKQLFRLTPEALVTPSRAVPFASRQGRYHAYLDLGAPMRIAHHGATLAYDTAPEPAVTIEVYRGTLPALLLKSDVGPPLKAIRTECRP